MMKRKRTCGARNPFYVTPSLNEKYSRQMLFAGIGPEGQARLAGSSAVIVGCGAIGAAVAHFLVRAGGGRIRILERGFVGPSNLQRQILFYEGHARGAVANTGGAGRKHR